MKNPIVELLQSVAESGTESTGAERAGLASRGGHTEREVLKREVKNADRQIRLLLKGKLDAPNGDVEAEVQRIIAETADRFERFVVDDPSAVSASTNALVDKIQATSREGGSAGAATSLERAKEARRRATPLREILEAAADGAAIHDSDLDALPLDPSVDQATRVRFRGDVAKSIRRIGGLRKSGALQDARDAASSDAARYGNVLAAPRKTDPAEGIEDPRELADLIRGRSNGNG